MQTLGNGEVREERKLHIGCATITPSGWINLDGSWNAALAKYPSFRRTLGFFRVIPSDKLAIHWNKNLLIHDVRKGLPFPDNHLTAVYASHLLEHLYQVEAKSLLRECLRTLQPRGVIRLVVPDLYSIVLKYMDEWQSEPQFRDDGKLSAADKLCERLGMRLQAPPQGNLFYRFYTTIKDFHSHKWMYDKQSLVRYLSEAGFIDVSEKQFHESQIPGIEEIEKRDRVADQRGICVEAVKPSVVRP